jgi:excisionase family DNA binding protein
VIDETRYPPNEKLTTAEAADAVGYNRRTIVAWIRRGILPATRRPGLRGHYRIKWQDLLDVLNSPAVPTE